MRVLIIIGYVVVVVFGVGVFVGPSVVAQYDASSAIYSGLSNVGGSLFTRWHGSEFLRAAAGYGIISLIAIINIGAFLVLPTWALIRFYGHQ